MEWKKNLAALTAVCCLAAAVSGCSGTGTAGNSAAQNGQGPDSSQGGGPGGQPPGGGGSQTETSGNAVTTFNTETEKSGGSYSSTTADENAVRVEGGAKVTLSDITVSKTGDSSSTDNSNFYGMNAGVLVRDKGTLTLTGGTVSTNGSGGNGVFAYNTGSTLNISGTKIRTSKDNSGGIEAAGGSIINATNLDIETQGNSAAAIRSDRGGGTMTVNQGTYVTNGTGSPSIYCTAAISVSDATLTANHSEAIVIEGKNTVKLQNCTVSGNMSGTYGQNSGENLQNVMIYQSMSGDAEQGSGSLTMSGGSMTCKNGDMFYVTNTTAVIDLSGVKLTNADGNLLTVAGNSRNWGTSGSNGGKCTFTASGQQLKGSIVVDKISSLDLTLSKGSSFSGTINSTGAAGTVNLTLSADSTWSLTGNAYLTTFNGDATKIVTNGYTVYVDGKVITK